MKTDRTHWQCDRCKAVVTVPVGENPDTGGWWRIGVHRLQNRHSTPTPDVEHDLCSTCVNLVDRWLRNTPTHTYPGELETTDE